MTVIHAMIPAAVRAVLRAKKIDYDWAGRIVAAMATLEPRVLALATEAPVATRHYICLCIAALHEHPKSAPPLHELATRIAATPRRDLLEDLWGVDLGAPHVLSRCGKFVFDEASYVVLARLLADPLRRQTLARMTHVTRTAIHNLADVGDDEIACFNPNLLGRWKPDILRFIFAGLAKLRTDLTARQIMERMNAVETDFALKKLVERLLEPLPLPPPPWPGTDMIVPVTTVADLRALGLRMRNCLKSVEMVTAAIAGEQAYYRIEGKEPCIAGLNRQRSFGLWHVGEIKRASNRSPTPARKDEISDIFAKAGFPFFPYYELNGLIAERDYL